ncbi:hypothetical protein C8R44DRAFT_740886 [Mycena epipterygia]|nr:hypothetical protein C8R44DRAFT_740886 [Mycena epipterygia]
MPPKTTVTETRLDNTIACLTPIISLLNEFSDAFGPPFIPAISNTTLSLITLVQNVKKNKEQCIQLMENIHQVLYTVINLLNVLIKSGTGSSLPPAILHNLGRLTEVYAFMEVQQDGNKIKHFFRQSEMKTLLYECHTGLQQAFDAFKMESATNLHGNIVEMQNEMERIHKELLELISTSSDATISEKSSSDSARIAILGAGGMGKTSLAKAALHHPDIASKYQNRFFVASDSATTSIELAALIGLHLGLKPGKDLTKPVVHYFSDKDNLETLWEPMDSRAGVEEFLSSLTDVSHLALMATHQTFVAIAEDFHDNKDITTLLSLTNNMPLAVDLMAHLVDQEGCGDVLARWETEKTSLLSEGHDKRSNLDISITISLSSPRLSCGAKDLLSLLSILPDGLSDAELLQSKLPIKNILECRSMLLRTSLAYEDDRKRLKSLVPIQEYMQQLYYL